MSPPLIQGIVASLGIHTFVDACFASTIVRQRSGRCFFLNGALFLGSIGVFDWVIGPAARAAAARSDWALLALGRGAATDDAVVQRVSSATVDAVASTTFQLAWLLPIYVTSMLLSGAWYSDLADAARQLHSERDRGEQARGSASAAPAAALRVKAPKKKRRTTAADPEAAIADEIYRTLFLVVVLLQATLCALIPIVGQLLTFCLLSWTYAFYSFDYKWSAMGWRVAQRIAHIEHHWLYFLGFGAPFTLATFYWSTFVGAALFQTLFPLVRCVLCVTRATCKASLFLSRAHSRSSAFPFLLHAACAVYSRCKREPCGRRWARRQGRAARVIVGGAARVASFPVRVCVRVGAAAALPPSLSPTPLPHHIPEYRI